MSCSDPTPSTPARLNHTDEASGEPTPEGEPLKDASVCLELPEVAKGAEVGTAQRTTDFSASFQPDCGAKGEAPHLSRALAEERARLQSPTDPATGQRLRTRDVRIGGITSLRTNLTSYGVGITLYFKLFRFLVIALSILTLLGLPRCVVAVSVRGWGSEVTPPRRQSPILQWRRLL